VRPPAAIAWRVWIARSICVRMMYAVRHNPLDWTTFKGHRAASHEKVLDQLWHLVTAVRKQPVIAHTNTKTASDPVKDDSRQYGGPAPEKKRYNCSNVGNSEETPGTPIPAAPIDLPSLGV